MRRMLVLAGLVLAFPVIAQESASFRLSEHVFNAGGHPDNGTVVSSASFRITLDAIGDGTAGTSLFSPSFRMDGGFVSAYPPPGEVHDLRFTSSHRLEWRPERSKGVYNLYRDDACFRQAIPREFAYDQASPHSSGQFFSYLVTVENRLSEEGTRGFDTDGGERPNDAPCP